MAWPTLSRREIAFFVREGYLLKRQALDPALLRQAQALHAERLTADPPPTDFDRELRAKKLLLDLLPRRLLPAAEQLLGRGTLVEPSEGPAAPDGPKLSGGDVGIGDHLRAIVSRPLAESPDGPGTRRAQLGAHIDAHPFSLGVCAYLYDVAPGSGEFNVWPRTHVRAFRCFPWQYSSRLPDHAPLGGDGGNEGVVKEVIEAVKEDTVPVALHARAGDVILWHHRIVTRQPSLATTTTSHPGRPGWWRRRRTRAATTCRARPAWPCFTTS